MMMKYTGCDRLSELPDSLIFEIFGFLPMTDVVQTTILSKRWKNLWTTVPFLDFDFTKMEIDTNKFRGFVNGAINCWRGVKIVKFVIRFSRSYRSGEVKELLPSGRDYDSWMKFATQKKVEDLKLDTLVGSYELPQCLLTCSSLQVLYFQQHILRIHGDLRWDRLKSLTLNGIGLSEDSMNRVLSGSPLLEFLELRVVRFCGNLSIRSSSLKCLIIDMNKLDTDSNPELRISTPNLKKIEYEGILYSKCLLMDVSSLTEVSFRLIASFCYLPTIEHVERVTLSRWHIEALGAMRNKDILSSFPNAKFLMFKLGSNALGPIVGALALFPKLRDLVIITTAFNEIKIAEICPKSPLPQLRTVDVTWKSGEDDSISPLVQNLLKYAINLEKIVLREKKCKPTPSVEASDIFRKMERSYPTVEFVFY